MSEDQKGAKSVIQQYFFDIDGVEIIILKSHLFIESMITNYIARHNKSEKDINKMRFAFMTKVKIAEVLGLFVDQPNLKTYVLNLNKIRNQIAHTNEHDQAVLHSLIDFPRSFETQEEITDEAEFIQETLKIKSAFMGGFISGAGHPDLDSAEIPSTE